jgi:transglutaminase-like putative cysteine protease
MAGDEVHALGAFVQRALERNRERSEPERLFYAVRDLPYATDAAHDAPGLIQVQRGDCVAKSDLLSRSLRSLDLETRIVRWLYRLPPHPSEVQLLPTLIDVHTAVQVQGPCGWIVVDATHDPALAAAGLTVGTWDCRNDTALAYEPLGSIWMEGDAEIAEALSNIQESYSGRNQDATVYRTAFNRWLDSFRYPSGSTTRKT